MCAQPAPVAYLPFDEGSGNIAHDVVGNHNATSVGAASWTTGLVGPFALSLPSTTSASYAEIPGDVVDTTKSYTVAAWVNVQDLTGPQTFVSEVSEDAASGSAFLLQVVGPTPLPNIAPYQFGFVIPYNFLSFPQAQSGFTPVVNQWYHLAGVYNAVAKSASLWLVES